MPQIIPKHQVLFNLLDRIEENGITIDKDGVRLGLGVIRFASGVVAASETHFTRYNLSQARYAVLAHLYGLPDEKWTPAKLASTLGVTRATLTGVLDVLERDDLIMRKRHDEDGRKTMVILTPTGERKLQEVLPDHFRRAANAMSVLSKDESTELFRLLSKIKKAFHELKQP